MKKIFIFILAIIASLAFASCEKNELGNDIASIFPDPTMIRINVGESCSIKVNATYSDGSTKNIASACDFKVIKGGEYFKVTQNKVTGVAEGNGAISLYYDGQLVCGINVSIKEK